MTKLTPRQNMIVSHLAQGWKAKDLAIKLGTSPQVISEDIKHIRKRQGSIEKAIQNYLETNDPWTGEDEKPDEDEPAGPVQRCNKCDLILPHDCLNGQSMMRRSWPRQGLESACDDLDSNVTRPRTFGETMYMRGSAQGRS